MMPADLNTMQTKFFIRVPKEEMEKAKSLFAIEREISIPECDEYAFITKTITEMEFKDKAQLVHVKNKIRVEF